MSNHEPRPRADGRRAERGGSGGRVSTNGGEQPRWRGDGKEIYFLSLDAKLMAASVDTKTEFESGTPTILFQINPRVRIATTEVITYDVSRDGQRFLVNTN